MGVSHRNRMKHLARVGCAIAALVVGCGADRGARSAPKFEGTKIPDPPEQKAPWMRPESRLPRFLINATATLFEQGLADPRGCEYRAIEVVVGHIWGGSGGTLATHGWVLPAAEGEEGRFAVAWNGLVYPVVSVGEKADLDADLRQLKETVERARTEAEGRAKSQNMPVSRRSVGFHSFGAPAEGSTAATTSLMPIKVCLLLRLGRPDLAETVWAAGTGWTPGTSKRDLTPYGVSYLSLATDWAWSLFDRTICAHMRGDDHLALAGARVVATAQKAIEARAEEMGFPRRDDFNQTGRIIPYLDFLGPLPDLLADQERRATEPRRGPVPPRGAAKTERIAALIRDLDQVAARQMGQPGGVSLGGDPIVQALIGEGDDAVEPLLDCLEHDTRLTRSVHFWRDFDRRRTILGVHEAAYVALSGILKTSFFGAGSTGDDLTARGMEGRKAVAARVRAYWEKYKAVPLTERWYRILADDHASPQAWLQVAGNIAQPENVATVPGSMAFTETLTTSPRPGVQPGLRGESLRARVNPSVAELLARRVESLARPGGAARDDGLSAACNLALTLARWDARAARPVLRDLSRRLRDRTAEGPDSTGRGLAQRHAQITLARLRGGDPEALDEYAAWVRTITPEGLDLDAVAVFEPMWRNPKHTAIDQAADWLFNDPRSAWVPLIARRQGAPYQVYELITSPMLGVPGFRKHVLAALGDKARAGTVRGRGDGTVEIQIDAGWSTSASPTRGDPLVPKPASESTLRMADFYAWQLSKLECAPLCQPYWPEAKRDEAIAACIAFLGRYGERFAFDEAYSDRERDFPHPRAHLSFPPLDHPASRVEVEQGKAVFSLEGDGERRVVPLAVRPLRARRVGNREDSALGFVWQAEEVFKEGLWRRSYGFLGPHDLAVVPADAIEFPVWPGPWRSLSGPLDAWLVGPESLVLGGSGSWTPIAAGTPLVVSLRLRNRGGLDLSLPTEFVRPTGADGAGPRPALRRGVVLALSYAAVDPSQPAIGGSEPKWEGRPPKITGDFTPGNASRTLGPAESIEALRLDLNDWFAIDRPGLYRLRIDFTKDCGFAEGASNETTFPIVEAPAGGRTSR